MRTLRHTMRLLGLRWPSWLGFEAVVLLVAVSLVFPLLVGSLDAAMGLAGLSYITYENVFSFVAHPTFLLLTLVWLAFLALIVLVELSGLHYALARDSSDTACGIFDVLRYALSRLPGFLRPDRLPRVAFVLVLVPLFSPGLVVGVVRGMDLDAYLTGFVGKNPVWSLLSVASVLALVIVVLRHAFAVVFFVSEDLSLREAVLRAQDVGRHHAVGDVAALVLVPNLLMVALSLVLLIPLLPFLALSGTVHLATDVFCALTVIVDAVVALPFSYATMLTLLEGRGKASGRPEVPATGAVGRMVPALTGFLVVASLVGIAVFVHRSVVVPLQGGRTLDGQGVRVCAHRGGASAAPENTMAAFRQAKADGADSCEIDVRQSADGRLFVSHDANFSRISHVDKNCWELTFEQISQLDATGDAWRGRVEPQHYPSLDEVIDWAAEHDMRLNIELKPTGHEVGFEEAVVEAIDVHDFWGSCIVTSQALHAIERVKELSPASVCAYVTSTAYGDICQLEAADAFSLEAITASPSLVSSLHDHDRGVLAWAGDSEPSMRRLVANGVDVLVTDDVSLARRVADEAGSLSLWEKMFYSFVAVLS